MTPIIDKIKNKLVNNKITYCLNIISTNNKILGYIALFSVIFAIFTYYDGSKQISSLEYQLNETQKELVIAKNEINNVSLANTKEILLAIYEVKNFGLDNQSRENFFQTKFGISYEQAQSMLKYLSNTDDYNLAFNSLMLNDYPSSLYHFDMALIKDPKNNESKIGKSTALIGLNRTNESREILFGLEPTYYDKKFINKLIGDSYYVEGNYSKSLDYYMPSLGYYFTESGTKDIIGLELFSNICEIKAKRIFDSRISIINLNDGWNICEISLRDFGLEIKGNYKFSENNYYFDYIIVRPYTEQTWASWSPEESIKR